MSMDNPLVYIVAGLLLFFLAALVVAPLTGYMQEYGSFSFRFRRGKEVDRLRLELECVEKARKDPQAHLYSCLEDLVSGLARLAFMALVFSGVLAVGVTVVELIFAGGWMVEPSIATLSINMILHNFLLGIMLGTLVAACLILVWTSGRLEYFSSYEGVKARLEKRIRDLERAG